MTIQGIPAGGFKTVGEIVGTNSLQFSPGQEALSIAVELLSAHTSGGPVVSDEGKFLGFISEYDLLEAVDSGKDLSKLKAKEIMNTAPISVNEDTSLSESVKLMKEHHLLVLPVINGGNVVRSITRHDLLRAWVGLGLSGED